MAAANPGLQTQGREQYDEDLDCRYTLFANKPSGKVPCLAVGKDDVPDLKLEITGICFQKASTGEIKPILPNDRFTDVTWNNAPTRIKHDCHPQPRQFLDIDNIIALPAVIPLKWQDFADTMRLTRNAMLDRMTPPGEGRPESLLKAFQKSNNAENPVDVNDLAADARLVGHSWTLDPTINKWVDAVTDGCYGRPAYGLACVFETLFPELIDLTNDKLVLPPDETSNNATLKNGVPHCLIYGYRQEQIDELDEIREQNHAGDGNRGRPKCRVLLSKRTSNKARSRSPVSDNDDVEQHVDYIGNGPSVMEMVANPDNYEVNTKAFSKFFQPHKPDLVLVSKQRDGFVAKLVCQIASWNKDGRYHVTLKRLVDESTEQCVQSCLSALAFDQSSILGLVVVVDGFKVIKITKRHNGGHLINYQVDETELVLWNESQRLYALFQMIRNACI